MTMKGKPLAVTKRKGGVTSERESRRHAMMRGREGLPPVDRRKKGGWFLGVFCRRGRRSSFKEEILVAEILLVRRKEKEESALCLRAGKRRED